MLSQLKPLAVAAVLLGASTSASAVALLNGFGGDRGYGQLAMSPNDDGSSNQLNLPFSVNFFGSSYSTFFINNNGNITFRGPVGTFTPQPFPISNQPMIAPFWADVDTRPQFADRSNNVWVSSPNGNTTVVTWDMVGRYNQNASQRNDLQLVLRNRPDTGAGNFDVDFRYNQLTWTQGSVSAVPAQAGYDSGNGTQGEYLMLPGSRTANVLNLQNTSNVDASTPGLWTFAIRNGQLPGSDPSNPLLPTILDGGWSFNFGIQLNQQIFIDPVVATGYDYIVDSGPLFASVELPTGIGDNLFDLFFWNGTEFVDSNIDLTGGVQHAFASPVSRFGIRGIETSANLDPTDPLAFVTGLTFDNPGVVSMRMIPVTTNVPDGGVPEPGSLILAASALGLLLARRRRMMV